MNQKTPAQLIFQKRFNKKHPVNRPNHSDPSVTKIRNDRSRLVTPSETKTKWHPHVLLRNAVIAMRKLERKFERLHAEAEKRINKYLSRFPRMAVEIKERKKEIMLKKAKAVTQDRLIRKANKIQKSIDEMNKEAGQSFNQIRRAA